MKRTGRPIWKKVDAVTTCRMKVVRRKGTSLENQLSNALRAAKIKYRRNVTWLAGTPDFVLTECKIAVFVHGCFWHGHMECVLAKLPKSNRQIWKAKIESNRRRDSRKNAALRKLGYRVWVIWGCAMKDPARLQSMMNRLVKASTHA